MSETITSVEAQLVVTDWMSQIGFSVINWASHPEAGVRLFARTPVFDQDSLRNIESIADLDALPGWLPISGNLTAKSHRDEMGPLYYQQNVNSDHTTYTITLHNAPPTGEGEWPMALVENSRGWEITTGVLGIEQETVAAAAWYIKGVHGGVEDPVLMITDQGLSGDMLIRGGAMYGMTQYDPNIDPSILTWSWPSNPLVPVNRQRASGWVGTLYTDTPHGFVEGDLVRYTLWGASELAINSVIRVTNIIDAYTVQAHNHTYVSSPIDYIVTDFPGVTATLSLVNPVYKVGTVLLDTPTKAYEPTNAVHVWLRPQRMNLLVNPSFEGPTYNDNSRPFGWKWAHIGWEGYGALFSVPPDNTMGLGGVGALGSIGSGKVIVESNRFPIVENNFAGISLAVMGRGTMRPGLVAWDAYYKHPIFIRLPDVYVDNTTYTSTGLVPADGISIEDIIAAAPSYTLPVLPGSVEYNLRIEWIQGEYTAEEIDNGVPEVSSGLVIARPIVDPTDGPALLGRFFNGDSVDGLPGDHHWHGGVPHQHFSMWYNNRKNIESRLFGGVDEDTDTYEKGLLSDWTPSSAAVIPHWDAIEGSPVEGWQGDYFYPVKDVHDEPVLLHPWQEYDHRLRPFYPFALTDETGGLIRDDFGEPINLVYGERPDDILVNESGQPITDPAGNYIVVA